ncbi:MAG: 4-hydroxy-tetrahydrodipicolinate synthase, partial [Ornithinimicrobium sp.]
ATPFHAPGTPADRVREAHRASLDKQARPQRPAVDYPAFRSLIEHVRSGGVDYVVVLGSTGEAATVTDQERTALIEMARRCAGDLPIVVGVGHQDTERTCDLARAAHDAGADGLLVVTPFYNKPQPAGLIAHFQRVADEVPGMPIIAYNVPGRTGVNLDPSTLGRLWEIPQIVAIKESSGDLRQISAMCEQAPVGKHVIAGDDDLALPAIAVGARGLISVCANVAPMQTAAMVERAMSSDLVGARHGLSRLTPLMSAMFVETNPVPVKAGLAAIGIGTGMVRAPLAAAEPRTWSAVHEAVAGLELNQVRGLAGAAS